MLALRRGNILPFRAMVDGKYVLSSFFFFNNFFVFSSNSFFLFLLHAYVPSWMCNVSFFCWFQLPQENFLYRLHCFTQMYSSGKIKDLRENYLFPISFIRWYNFLNGIDKCISTQELKYDRSVNFVARYIILQFDNLIAFSSDSLLLNT